MIFKSSRKTEEEGIKFKIRENYINTHNVLRIQIPKVGAIQCLPEILTEFIF